MRAPREHGSDGFCIDKIPFSGAAGALVGVCGIAVLVEGIPSLRWPFLFCVVAGTLLGVGLVLYRRWS
jgi:drug/metabolite transporter (DMT)-like permease